MKRWMVASLSPAALGVLVEELEQMRAACVVAGRSSDRDDVDAVLAWAKMDLLSGSGDTAVAAEHRKHGKRFLKRRAGK